MDFIYYVLNVKEKCIILVVIRLKMIKKIKIKKDIWYWTCLNPLLFQNSGYKKRVLLAMEILQSFAKTLKLYQANVGAANVMQFIKTII